MIQNKLAAESDRSAGTPTESSENSRRFSTIENELVVIMEKWFSIKAHRISEAKLEYGI